MRTLGFVTSRPHVSDHADHKKTLIRCYEAVHGDGNGLADGGDIVELTASGRRRAGDIIRRHRLAERLFTETLRVEDEAEIEQQACKFEHILSPDATDRICSFLGHPRTCPHGAPIPEGACCVKKRQSASAD
jgi:Mn-dependent DtxR family transcriptional regulator